MKLRDTLARLGEGRAADRVLRIEEVSDRLGISRTTLWRWCREGHFPKARCLGSPRSPRPLRGWLESEVREWMDQRPTLSEEAS
jgi:prophage regulatory protein